MFPPQKLIRNHTQGEPQGLGCETVASSLFTGSFVLQTGGPRMQTGLSSGSLNFWWLSKYRQMRVGAL